MGNQITPIGATPLHGSIKNVGTPSTRTVAETDAAILRSLPRSVTSCLSADKTGRFTEDGQFLGTRKTYSLATGAEQLDEARAIVAAAMTPMERAELVSCLGRLKALTVARNTGETDLTMQLAAYCSELEKWPADVVREVLSSQPGTSKWWPAWADLETRLRELAGPRLALQAALTTPTRKPYRTKIAHGVWRDGR